MRATGLILWLAASVIPLAAQAPPEPAASSPYLFAWGSGRGGSSDSLVTIDVRGGSATFGKIVASTPAGISGGSAHHTEHEVSPEGTLFANLYKNGSSFVFDIRKPLATKLIASFGNIGPYSHAHSFVRLPNGNVLSTLQEGGHSHGLPGAVVEMSASGELLRVSPASDPKYPGFIYPYSLAIVPKLDRLVTTSHDMHSYSGEAWRPSRALQIWRLSDLELLKTIELPGGPREIEGEETVEARLLADGVTVLVVTNNCGLYRLTNLDGEATGELVHDFTGQGCALPVIIGNYWIQSAPPHSLVTLDISNPGHPKEVSASNLPVTNCRIGSPESPMDAALR